MMRFAQLGPVLAARGPSAELAFACVKVTQLLDQFPVTMEYDAHKVTSSFLCDTGWFITDKSRHGVLVARQALARWRGSGSTLAPCPGAPGTCFPKDAPRAPRATGGHQRAGEALSQTALAVAARSRAPRARPGAG
jgi:hypothetical protein